MMAQEKSEYEWMDSKICMLISLKIFSQPVQFQKQNILSKKETAIENEQSNDLRHVHSLLIHRP